MDSDNHLFDHVFVDNAAERTLFLLHGTGGSKEDFLFLDEALNKRYNLVGLEGTVDEGGMKRFFKRLAPGVFDQESIRQETAKLQMFFANWIKEHQLDLRNIYALGYSNGANILLSLIFLYPQLLQNFVLLHPMLPFAIEKGSLDLSAVRMFMSVGEWDQMVSPELQAALEEVLLSCNVELEIGRYAAGHEIHRAEITDIIRYLSK